MSIHTHIWKCVYTHTHTCTCTGTWARRRRPAAPAQSPHICICTYTHTHTHRDVPVRVLGRADGALRHRLRARIARGAGVRVLVLRVVDRASEGRDVAARGGAVADNVKQEQRGAAAGHGVHDHVGVEEEVRPRPERLPQRVLHRVAPGRDHRSPRREARRRRRVPRRQPPRLRVSRRTRARAAGARRACVMCLVRLARARRAP